jgi:hypothetical protein
MINLIKDIILTAQSLEIKGLSKHASQLDGVAESLTMIKQAQYDGVQGYWIRNGRCFDNCYREKRTKEAKKSAQEIWSECHEEWLKSLMSNSSEWDKYAKDSSNSMIKIAKSETTNFSDEILKDEIKEKVSSGLPISDAVPMTVAERMFSIPWKLAQVSNEVVEIAREVSESDPAVSEKLYIIIETALYHKGKFINTY